jgi:hypothetical protein
VVFLVILENLVIVVYLLILVYLVIQDDPVFLVLMALLELKVILDRKVQQVQLDHKGPPARKVLQVLTELLVVPDHRDL